MPDYKKFMQMKATFESMGQMMADYEKDFGENEGDSDESVSSDKDVDNGGQDSLSDLMPLQEIPKDLKDDIEPGRMDESIGDGKANAGQDSTYSEEDNKKKSKVLALGASLKHKMSQNGLMY